jgi:phosphoribosyl 1,2-cyclic phosphodiesterase
VEVRELPCDVSFRDAPETEWEIGSAKLQAASVTHRGPTLGYRITEGNSSLCYIPDHEPALGTSLRDLEPDWISGYDLAKDASLLLHDCQYSDDEYPDHIGWGHSALSDTLDFLQRTTPERTLLFHHDPLHTDDFLDAMYRRALDRWGELGGAPTAIEMATERREIELGRQPAGERATIA